MDKKQSLLAHLIILNPPVYNEKSKNPGYDE
jgi:hypothetical protein